MTGGLVPILERASWLSRARAPAPTKVDQAVERLLASEAALDVRDDLGLDVDDYREAAARAYRPKSVLMPIRQPRVMRRCL